MSEIICDHCKLSVPPSHLKRYYELRAMASQNMVKIKGHSPQPNDSCLELKEELVQVFHPCDNIYTVVLEAAMEKEVEK